MEELRNAWPIEGLREMGSNVISYWDACGISRRGVKECIPTIAIVKIERNLCRV